MDNKTIELYVDNFQSKNNYCIQWMEIKNKTNKNVLLTIPYSPWLQIENFTDAIHKQYISLPNSSIDYILQSIDILYNNNDIIFSKSFLNEIEELSDYAIIRLEIQYTLTNYFTYSHLYFLNKLSNRFTSIDVTKNTMTITTNKNEIFKRPANHEEEETWINGEIQVSKLT